MDVNFCYGVTPTETRPRFYEAHDLIMQAWTKPGPFTFNGRYNKLRYVNPWPKPLQKPHPPVWLAGGGSVETWELAATQDYTYSYLSFFGYQFAQKLMGGFWETMDRMGIDQNPYRAGFAQQICVSETDERAEEEYLEHVTYFFNKCLHIPPYFFEAPGYRTRRSTEFAIKTNQPGEIAKVALMEKNWKGLVDNGFIIAGSPATVADRLIEAAKSAALRQPARAAADRLDAPRPHREEHHAVRRRGHPPHPAPVGRRRAGSTSGGRSAPTTGARSDVDGRSHQRRLPGHLAAQRHHDDARARGWPGRARSSTSTAPAA